MAQLLLSVFFCLMCFIAVNQGVVSHSILVFLDRKCNRREKRGRSELFCVNTLFTFYRNLLLSLIKSKYLNTVHCVASIQMGGA